jgi:poly-gamma-glutamate synthesis protein (capsule biosynthesis protein)
MSVANNHANDLGREGLEQTPEVLRAAGITPVGEARHEGSPLRVVTMEHRGWRIGLVSATTWLNHAPTAGDPAVPVVAVSRLRRALVPLVEQARADHDLVIVLLHWGRERRERPEPAQIHAAHAFIDAGADLVIGHHPHVLQGIERYGNGLIAYSLGNFLFPAREEAFRDSAVLWVRVLGRPRRGLEATAHSVRLGRAPGHAPQRPKYRERRVTEERLYRLSAAQATTWRREAGALALRG